MLLGSGRYGGSPMPKHLALTDHVASRRISRSGWICSRARRTEMRARDGGVVHRRAERVGESFKLTMFFDPAAIAPKRG